MKRLLIALCVVLPSIAQASGLQASFTGSNLAGLTRSSTMAEFWGDVDVSGNLIDHSGRGHHLAPTNSPGVGDSTLQDNNGRRLKDRTFNGSNQHYSVAHHGDFNIGDANHTMTFVYKHTSAAAGGVLLFHGSGSNDGYKIYSNTTNIQARYSKVGSNVDVTSTTVTLNDGYYHIVQVIRDSDYARILIDGAASTPTYVGTYGIDQTRNLYFGSDATTYHTGNILYCRLDAEALSLDRLNYERNQIMGTGVRSGTADIGYDFSRTTTATQTHSDGTLSYVAANAPRSGGDGGGVKVEAQAENKALQSQTFGTTWTQTALTSITTDGAVAPDGTTTADGLVGTAADTQHGVTQDITETAVSWTHSIYAKPGNNDWLKISDSYGAVNVTWTEKAMGAVTKPSARQLTAMAYDSAHGVSVLFGGLTGSGKSDQTWEWNGTTWTEKASGAVTKPSARYSHAMAYDSARGVVVLFGGLAGAFDTSNNQTWEWNGTTWTEKASGAVTKPSARSSFAMAYDSARGVVVLFGGVGLQDTWEWNGTTWTEKASGAVTKPSIRYQHAMAYDPDRGVIVLHGGIWGANPNDETWEWDGINWVQSTSGATARRAHGMAYDTNRDVMVIFGGWTTALNDETWERSGTIWTQKSPVSKPAALGFHGMAFDSSRNVTVLFGGYDIANSDKTQEYSQSGSVTTLYAYYNVNTCQVGTTSGATAKAEKLSNGYCRASAIVTGTAETHTVKYYSASANADDTFLGDATTVNTWLWGAQTEAGAVASSYIPTTATSVTRTPDYLSIRPYKIGKGMRLGSEKMWIDFTQDATAATITTSDGGYTLTKSGTVARRNEYANGEYFHYLNGIDGYWYVNSSDFNPAGNFSVVAVITPSTVTGSRVIMSKYTATDDQRGWSLYQTDDDISISRTTDGTAGTLLAANVNNCLKIGKPALITGTYSTTAGLWVKVDALTAGTNAGATGTVHPSTYNFLIGNHGTGAYYNGNLHYAAFHDHGVGGTVLSEAQHDSLYARFKQANVLPPKIGTSYTAKQMTIEFEAKCPYSSTTDIGAKRVLLGITNYLSPVVTSTKNVIEVYHGSDGKTYGEIYDSTGGTQRYVRSAAMTTLNSWHKYKFYLDLSDLSNSTLTVDTTAASDYAVAMDGPYDVNVLDSLIRLGQTYDAATTSYLTNSNCSFKNLRIQPNRF